jgi:fructoselysine-6-P-deglycase FrlB-like protein
VELLLGEGRGNGESDEENKGGSRVFSDHSYQVQIRLKTVQGAGLVCLTGCGGSSTMGQPCSERAETNRRHRKTR